MRFARGKLQSNRPTAEIILSQAEYDTQYGVVPKRLPSWLAPHTITYTSDGLGHFNGSYTLTDAEDILLIPTQGHSFGHQSVLLRTPDTQYLFAGDVSFTDQQLKTNSHAGICADLRASRAILPAVLYRKWSFGVGGRLGSRFVERLMTVSGSLKKQG